MSNVETSTITFESLMMMAAHQAARVESVIKTMATRTGRFSSDDQYPEWCTDTYDRELYDTYHGVEDGH